MPGFQKRKVGIPGGLDIRDTNKLANKKSKQTNHPFKAKQTHEFLLPQKCHPKRKKSCFSQHVSWLIHVSLGGVLKITFQPVSKRIRMSESWLFSKNTDHPALKNMVFSPLEEQIQIRLMIYCLSSQEAGSKQSYRTANHFGKGGVLKIPVSFSTRLSQTCRFLHVFTRCFKRRPPMDVKYLWQKQPGKSFNI